MPLDHLRTKFAQQLASQAAELLQPLYVLVDPLVRDPLDTASELNAVLTPDDLCAKRQQLWGGWETLLIEVRAKAVQLQQMPYLVCLPNYQHASLTQSVDFAVMQLEDLQTDNEAVHSIGGWIQSAAQPFQVAQTLAALMVVAERATRKRYLRIGDPRVLQLVQYLLQPTTSIGDNLGCISRWYYVDELQQQVEHIHNEKPNEAKEFSALPLLNHHWPTLLQAEVINRALATWHSQQSEQAAMAHARQRVIKLAGKVHASGWQDPSDQLPLVLLHLLYPGFEEHAAFRDALAPTRFKKGLVSEALKTIRAQEWQRWQQHQKA